MPVIKISQESLDSFNEHQAFEGDLQPENFDTNSYAAMIDMMRDLMFG